MSQPFRLQYVLSMHFPGRNQRLAPGWYVWPFQGREMMSMGPFRAVR